MNEADPIPLDGKERRFFIKVIFIQNLDDISRFISAGLGFL